MKKILSVLIAIFLVALLSVSGFAESDGIIVDSYVVDNADLLTESQEKKLANYFAKIEAKRECSVIVVTENYVDGDLEAYTDDFFDYNGFGYGDEHTGVMMLIDMNEREWHITTTGTVIEYLQPYIEELGNAFIEGLNGTDDFYSGFYRFGQTVSLYLDPDFINEADDNYYDDENNIDFIYDDDFGEWIADDSNYYYSDETAARITICVIIGFVIALFTCIAIKNKNKSVHFKRDATNYTTNEGLKLTGQYDRFLYTTVSKTAKPKDDDHHSSGGGFSGGSIHVGSSGTSHGGGGGHF